MLVFCKNKILVKDNNYDFDDAYIFSHDGIETINRSPSQWHTLPSWLDVENMTLNDDEQFTGLRELWHISGDEAFSLASCACQFASWLRNFRMCPCCGGELTVNSHDFGRTCKECGKVYYAQQSPAVITAVEHDGKLLLAHNAAWPDERYSVIAGFVEPGERLEEAVRREIHEEVNISVRGIKYFGSQTWPFPNSLMLGFTAQYSSGEITPDGKEITHAKFFTPDEIMSMNIPDTASIARKLIDDFLRTH